MFVLKRVSTHIFYIPLIHSLLNETSLDCFSASFNLFAKPIITETFTETVLMVKSNSCQIFCLNCKSFSCTTRTVLKSSVVIDWDYTESFWEYIESLSIYLLKNMICQRGLKSSYRPLKPLVPLQFKKKKKTVEEGSIFAIFSLR